jgi:hypothetical protein
MENAIHSWDAQGRNGQGTGSGPTHWAMPVSTAPELFTMVMDYLDFHDIMCIGEYPEFPFELLHRRHLVKKVHSSILNEVVTYDWLFPSAIKRMILIIGNWDVGGENSWTYRPLLAAIHVRHYEFCELFFEAGARVNFCETTDLSEDTMRNFLKLINETTVSKFSDLIDSTGGMRLATPLAPLHIAVGKGKVELVDLLLRHGADPNLHAGPFGTALHFIEDYEMARLLVANGADVNARNGLGATPLFLAMDRYRENLFTMLIEAGADVNVVADHDDILLNLAI